VWVAVMPDADTGSDDHALSSKNQVGSTAA
jgi:hypothetical protein